MENIHFKVRVLGTIYLTETPGALIGCVFSAKKIFNSSGSCTYLIAGKELNKVSPQCFDDEDDYFFFYDEVEVVE